MDPESRARVLRGTAFDTPTKDPEGAGGALDQIVLKVTEIHPVTISLSEKSFPSVRATHLISNEAIICIPSVPQNTLKPTQDPGKPPSTRLQQASKEKSVTP